MIASLPTPLIDWAALHCLSDGDKEFEASLLQLFVDDTRSHLTALQTALQEHNLDGVRRLAHHLKGSSANVGAMGLSQLAATLEQDAREERLHNGPTLFQQMEALFEQIQTLCLAQ